MRIIDWSSDVCSSDLGGAILDGRDIATVIAPDADAKIFVTASVHVRAQRRYQDALDHGGHPDMDSLIADIQARDTRDMSRDHAPLRVADGAEDRKSTRLNSSH